MARFLAVKNLGKLQPIDDAGEEILRHVGQGEIVALELVRERNLQHHRKLFVLLSTIFENQSAYKSLDDLLDVAKLSVGHCKAIQTKEGLVKIPLSISFAAMDQDAFNAFYEKIVDWCVSTVIPGLSRRDLDAEVEMQLLEFAR